jgi:hypothetical protein
MTKNNPVNTPEKFAKDARLNGLREALEKHTSLGQAKGCSDRAGITEDSSLIHKVWILDEPVIAGRERIRPWLMSVTRSLGVGVDSPTLAVPGET